MALAVLNVIDAWEYTMIEKCNHMHARKGYVPSKLIHKWFTPISLARMEVECIVYDIIGTPR